MTCSKKYLPKNSFSPEQLSEVDCPWWHGQNKIQTAQDWFRVFILTAWSMESDKKIETTSPIYPSGNSKNPAPVDMDNIPLFTGFQKHPKRLAAFLPSTEPGF